MAACYHSAAMLDVIETERLVMRSYAERDLEAIVDFYSRPEVGRFLPGAQVKDRVEARAWLDRVTTKYEAYREAGKAYGAWAVVDRATDRLVGTSMLKPIPNNEKVDTADIEIGWHVHPDVWGKGIATEFGRALLRRGFEKIDVPRLHAVIDRHNHASRKVARKLGLDLREATDRYYSMQADLFAIERADWERRVGSARRAWSVSVFARNEGAVLLVFHKRLGTWLPVGGEVEADETPLEAARRELFEETSLDGIFRPSAHDAMEGTPRGFLGYEEHMAGKKGVHLNVSFVCDVLSRDVKLDDSLSEHRWVTLADGPWGEAPPNVRELARRALAAPTS